VREAAWLAHSRGNVWLDLAPAVTLAARPVDVLSSALDLAPVSKVLYGSSARTPELGLLAATRWRQALAEVLGDSLPPDEAEAAARAVLRENALGLYRLEAPVRESG
jgi:predicted TIM-barrel fold metal-dependent hydrolase